jgi:hypothetical protein
MGLSVFPAAAGGGIKSVQRGSAGSSGNVTITAVDINKSFVNIFGTTSSGTVAATGTVASHTFSTNSRPLVSGTNSPTMQNGVDLSGTIAAAAISGGTTNLVAAVVQGFLANSTTLTVSGACRWEVVEFA